MIFVVVRLDIDFVVLYYLGGDVIVFVDVVCLTPAVKII
jgi:hypothetical protein